jgi:hypothetical protein
MQQAIASRPLAGKRLEGQNSLTQQPILGVCPDTQPCVCEWWRWWWVRGVGNGGGSGMMNLMSD